MKKKGDALGQYPEQEWQEGKETASRHLLAYSCGVMAWLMTLVKALIHSSWSLSVSQVKRYSRSGVTMVMP